MFSQDNDFYPRIQSRVSVIHANVDINNSPSPGTFLINSVELNDSPGTSRINYVEPNISNSNIAVDKELEYSEMKRKIMQIEAEMNDMRKKLAVKEFENININDTEGDNEDQIIIDQTKEKVVSIELTHYQIQKLMS